MRKAEKRRLGEIKFQKDLEESRRSGLRALEQDRKLREEKERKIAMAKDRKREKEIRDAIEEGVVHFTANIKEFGVAADKAAAQIRTFAETFHDVMVEKDSNKNEYAPDLPLLS